MKTQIARILRLQNKLQSEASGAPKAGYLPNRWGTYWQSDIVDEIVSIRAGLLAQEKDLDEWSALSVSQIGTLVAAMRLSEAKAICTDLLQKLPDRATYVKRELAYIEALAGNAVLARNLADEVNSKAVHSFQRVVSTDLEREIEFGIRFASIALGS